MFTTNYSCYILKKRHANIFGVLLAFAIVAAVFYGVGIYAGKKAPRGLNEIMPYILITTLGLTALSIAYYFTKRFKVIITGENDKLYIEIKDPSLTSPLIITSPFNVSTQYVEQPMAKGAKMNILYLTLYNIKNERFVTFEGALGSAYSVPKKFEFVDIFNSEDRQRLLVAPLVYSTGKVRQIADEISIYNNYLEKKKETKGGHASG